MYLEVYPDIVFLINLIVDIILITLVKKVNKKNSSKTRIILGAACGACGAVIVSVFPWMNLILKFALIYVVTSLLMIFIAFGRLKIWDLFKQWIVLNLITYFVGGFMNSIYYHTNLRMILINISDGTIFSNLPAIFVISSISVITIIAMSLLWILRLYQVHRPLIYDVELVLENRKVKAKGLMDTGNCLYDPIRRKPVMVMENILIEELLTPSIKGEMEMAKSYLEGKSEHMLTQGFDILRFSFIPYKSIGKTGMLLGIKLDKVMIHTEKEVICNEKVIAAICDNPLTGGKEDYHLILHKELL